MKSKKVYLLNLAAGLLVGSVIAAAVGTEIQTTVKNFESANLYVECNRTRQVYTKEKPEIGEWYLKIFLQKVNELGSKKFDINYKFYTHARLFYLYRHVGSDSKNTHLNQALKITKTASDKSILQVKTEKDLIELIEKRDFRFLNYSPVFSK